MEEEKGIYNCSQNAAHRFKKNKDGFFELYRV
jgi:YHS domain-containing protein